MPRSLLFSLAIPAEEILRLYKGEARQVQATSHDGRILRFSAEHLRAFVTHDGVHGTFRIDYEADGRFRQLEKLD